MLAHAPPPTSGHFSPDYINLEGDNREGPPPTKRPQYWDACTSTYCAYAALDTPTTEEDEDDQEDAEDPESYYTSAPADSLAQ